MNYSDWVSYFKYNKSHFDWFSQPKNSELTKVEKSIIKASIQQFQRGENSEGKNLFKYSKDLENSLYIDVIKLFIKEEQTHAKVLGMFMKAEGIERISGHWVDNVFRKLRNLASLENSVMVLITAEIIATVYYIALKNATDSRTLKTLCRQILANEGNTVVSIRSSICIPDIITRLITSG